MDEIILDGTLNLSSDSEERRTVNQRHQVFKASNVSTATSKTKYYLHGNGVLCYISLHDWKL